MARICLTAPTKVELTQDANGRYRAIGPGGGELAQLFIGMTEKLIANQTVTYHCSDNEELCMQELKSNESDISSILRFLDENAQNYTIPTVMADSRIEFTTGYTIASLFLKHSRESTALSNFTLLDAYVQVINVILSVLMATCVVARCIIFWRQNVILASKRGITLKSEMKREVSHLFFLHSSSNSRWVSFLFSLLIFYLINSFKISYKTSHVVMDKPFIVSSYTHLLQDDKSLPVFWNFLYSKSKLFENSPPSSLRGQIWAKLMKSGKDLRDHIHDTFDVNEFDFFDRVFEWISRSHYIFIGSTEDIQIWKGLICAMSPPGQLRRLFVFSDPSENARLAGLPVSKFYSEQDIVKKAFTRITELGVFRLMFLEAKILMMRMMLQLFLAGAKHRYEQTLACDDDFKFKEDTTVTAITVNYFVSFFYATLIIIILVTIVLGLEQSGWSKNRTGHSSARRSPERPHLRYQQRMGFYLMHASSWGCNSPQRLFWDGETNELTFEMYELSSLSK